MLARHQAEQILRALQSLPAEKVKEVQDFVCFLQERYGVDESDAWSEEDLADLTAAAFGRFESEP